MCKNNEDKHCITCYNKSFASLEDLTPTENSTTKKVDCWDYEKNDKKPWEVFKSTNKKIWFKCDNCPHSFNSVLYNILSDSWCPYCCVSSEIFCDEYKKDYNNCQHCFNKSFASSELLTPIKKNKKVDCWDYEKNNKKPWEVFKSKGIVKFWFKCDNCPHSFNSTLNHITNGRWCPYCKNKTELKLYKWLQELYPNYTIKTQYKKKWCRNPDPNYKKKKEPCYYPYDFNIQIKELKLNIIIELDGRQHFEYVSHFDNNVEERQIIDLYKMFQAFKNNHSFIRIFQEDVYYDNNDWENKLKDCINKIIKSNHIMSLYVDNENIYDIYRTRDPYKILYLNLKKINQIKNQ
jgi:hypothetical protein